MSAEPLTAAERKWIRALQATLSLCPSKRMIAFTTGDNDVTIYDRSFRNLVDEMVMRGNVEVGQAVHELDAELATLRFPFLVQSTAG